MCPGEGSGGSGGDPGGGGGGGGGPGGGDIAAIIAYLNSPRFGTDGDHTGNAGYGGENTGPIGSEPPPKDYRHPATGLTDMRTAPRRDAPDRLARRGAREGTWGAFDAYCDLEPTPGSFLDLAGARIDALSGLSLDLRDPDPFTDYPASDPFIEDWPARTRSIMAPFAALRPTRLLSSPNLLADNAVVTCDPNRATCLPEMKSDANQSGLATSIQAEMDESYVAIRSLMEGRGKVAGASRVDMQEIAATAAAVARSDEYQLASAVNRLRDHPLEIRHSSVLTGLGHVASGGIMMTASGFIIYGSGGLAAPLIGATGFAAGLAEVQSGAALAVSGADSKETVRMSGQLDYVFALTASPTSLVFGTTGLVLSGDQDISHRFALAGGIAEGMTSFRGDPSKLYSTLLPGVETTTEKAATTLLVKDVTALGFTARGQSVDSVMSKLNTNFTVDDILAIQAFREEATATGRLDLAGAAGHAAAGAAPRGVDFVRHRGAFIQELKLHGPHTGIYQQQLDKAWTQSLTYSIKYQLETRAFGEQLVPLRSVKHIWIGPTEALRYVR